MIDLVQSLGLLTLAGIAVAQIVVNRNLLRTVRAQQQTIDTMLKQEAKMRAAFRGHRHDADGNYLLREKP